MTAQSFEESFLQEIDEHRALLARSFKSRNPQLDSADLAEITQRAIDRLVFMRFLEDRLIEQQPLVENFGTKATAWQDFIAASRRLDQTYNGIIFKHHDLLDSPDFRIDDRVFEDIRESLAHTNSPYDFNLIPIHILGSIYERFLGKTIVATNKQARVEDKPEVRKAGGVYYTPEYIVRYIVENTVGKLIEGKTPEQIAEMRFADIACGSGSFLLGVYDLLLRRHAAYYNRNKTNRDKGAKAGCLKRDDGTLQLSLKQKQAILVNNIYGVDIDQQAAEVAQLSLYLKLLEEETTATSRAYQLEFGQRLLPSLNQNIVSGNSLIGWDILEGKLFDIQDERKLNPMDFKAKFPEAMKRGGFDAIVGNPPWGASLNEMQLEYLRKKNRDIIVRMIDSFMYFVHKGCALLKTGGAFGMILPDVILYQKDNQKLREFLLNKFNLQIVLNLGDVFENVTRPASILILEKTSSIKNAIKIGDFTKIKKPDKSTALLNKSFFQIIAQEELTSIPGASFVTSGLGRYSIWARVKASPCVSLAELIDDDGIQRGVSPDLKKAFLVETETINEHNLEKERLKRVLTGGKQVKRYFIDYPELWVIYTKREDDFKQMPHICSYINRFKNEITCKEVKEKKHSLYALHRSRNERIFLKKQKIVGVITDDQIIVALDNLQTYATDGLYLFGVKDGVDPKYLMAVLNSRLYVFLYRLLSFEEGRPLAQVKPTLLAQLPIRAINFSDPEDKARHDRLAQLVEQMLAAKQQLAQSRSDRDKDFFENKCAAIDLQIDKLVYELYQLTDEEIAVVETAR